MSQYYLPADISRYVDENGGRDYLVDLVQRDRQQVFKVITTAVPVPREFCVKCGVRLRGPDSTTCFHCGVRQP